PAGRRLDRRPAHIGRQGRARSADVRRFRPRQNVAGFAQAQFSVLAVRSRFFAVEGLMNAVQTTSASRSMAHETSFTFVLIKPTHYDDQGYPIQWFRSALPSNTLACMYSLAEDARRREVLGSGADFE